LINHETLRLVDDYINEHVGTKSTRHVSEDLQACPPSDSAIMAERGMRVALMDVYDSTTSTQVVGSEPKSLDELGTQYWSSARFVTSAHGANPMYELEDYLQTRQSRHYEALKRTSLEACSKSGIIVQLLDALDAYQDAFGIDHTLATRIFFNLFEKNLLLISQDATTKAASSGESADATRRAINEFASVSVDTHIEYLQELRKKGYELSALVEKDIAYPNASDTDSHEPLILHRADAQALMAAYHMREYPYSEHELRLGNSLVGMPRMRHSLLQMQLDLISDAKEYLEVHPERRVHSLAPFSEVFVPLNTDDESTLILAPNPHLLKVIANNIMPAIARRLTAEDKSQKDLSADHIVQGILLAAHLKVFQTKIGIFNDGDAQSGTVALYGMLPRTCPGNRFIITQMIRRLPVLFTGSPNV
jgi:hypothetical protein